MRGKFKRILSNVITAAMFVSLLPGTMVTAMAATDARHEAVAGANGDNVFLGNNKLELGINECGSFGSTAEAPSNFHPDQVACGSTNKYLGMITYADEDDGWVAASDFFLPGTVDEGFVFAWASTSDGAVTEQASAKSTYRGGVTASDTYTDYSTTDESTDSELKAVTTATVADTLSYTQTVSFSWDAGVAGVQIVLKNNTLNPLYNLEYVRGFDPDQGRGSGAYSTSSALTNNYFYTDNDGVVWAIASTEDPSTTELVEHTFDDFTTNHATYPYIFMAPISPYYTVTPVSQDVGWWGHGSYTNFKDVTADAANYLGYQLGYSKYDDNGLGLRFHIPELDAGDSVTLFYNMSLDSDIENALSQLAGGNLALQPESYVVNTGATVELSVDMATLFSDDPEGTTYIYQWYSCATEEGTYSAIGGATDETYTAPTETAGTNYYKCMVTPSTGSTVTTGLARVTVLESTATTYEVEFDANTSDTITNMPGTQTVKSDDKVLEPKSLVREGYTLAGWYTESLCTNKWDFNASPTSNMTLFAKWIFTPAPTVSFSDGKIYATHGSAADGETMSAYTMEYSPDNGENWYTYNADGTAIDFTTFAADGYSENIANLLFRQTSMIDSTPNIIGTTSAITIYKVSHTIATGDSTYGDVTLAVTENGATDATDIGSMGNAYPDGATLTYTVTPNNTISTSYFAGINSDKNFSSLNGTFTPVTNGKYAGGTYTFTSLAASQSSEFYFGNWKNELDDAFADGTNSKVEDLDAAVGESGSEQRVLFTTMFPDVDLTTYDNLTDKNQVLTQYIENDSTDTVDEIVGDLTNRSADDSKSTLENFAETQSQLEGNPTYPEVSIDPTDSIAEVTPPASVTNPTVTVKDSSGNEISAVYLTSYDLDGKIADAPNNYITVQVTDATVNYNVTVRVYVNVSTYKIEENSAILAPSIGGTLDINSDNSGSAERTLDNDTPQSDEVYTVQSIQWKGSGDDAWNNGSLPMGQPYATVLTAEANDGAYFTGFRYGSNTTLYTPENIGDFCTISGDSGATFTKDENGSSDPADWVYTLTYTPKDKQTITGVYRNLLGEINEATTIDQISSVIADSNFGNTMHEATGTQLNDSSDITGEVAKDAYSNLDDTSKNTILTKLLNGVSERDDYTIEEFSDALYWTSKLQELINDGLAKVGDAYSSGSWTELQTVLANAKNEYDAAGNGTDEITTAREEALCKQIQSALDQLTLKTLAVEIVTNADGVKNSVSFSAANPTLSDIVASTGQNGYAFPVYGSSVVISAVAGGDYNVEYTVDDDVMSDLTEVNEELSSVTQHTQVKIIFTKKTVDIAYPDAGVEAVTADVDTNTDGLQVNINDVATLRIVPSDGQIIIPGASVKYTIDGVEHSAVVQADGSFVVNTTDDIVVTDISAALKDLDKSSLTQLLNAVKSKYDSNSDTLYNTTDLNWTQETWENLFGTDNEGGIYGGVYAEALAVAENAETTSEELQAAVEALTEAANALKPQYTITLADGFTMQNDGQPAENPQIGVVMMDDTWYAAEGTSVVLDVTVPEGKDLNKISYRMGGQTLYAWASGGTVTIYGVSDAVNSLTMDVSDSGFSSTPTEGGIGAATGDEFDGNTYVLTPDEGSELVSITIDGQKSLVPDDTELAGIVSAAFAEDYTDGDVGETTIEINGRDVEFTKYNVEDTENEIPAGAIIGSLPGVGKVQITVSEDTISATVITPGSDGYQAGTVITITTDGTDSHEITGIEVQPNGTEYSIDFDTPTDGATVTWTKQNTGSHSVTAETRLKTYSVTIAKDGEEPSANVGGITASAATVKHGGTLALTIPTPEDIDDIPQEVAMTSTVTFTVGGTNYSDTLAALKAEDNGISVVIKEDGSATLTVTDISGDVNVTEATVDGEPKGTTQAVQGLEADKTLFTEKLAALQDALTEANVVNTNTGNIYDETTDEWTVLTDASTGEIKEKSDLNTDLSVINLDDINSEEDLISAIEDKLGVEPGTKTLDELLDVIDTATEELVNATNDAKILAEDVISIPKDTQYEGDGTNVDGLTDKGTVETDPTNSSTEEVVNTANGADLVIGGIKTEAGYMPVTTVTVSGENGNSYEVIIRVAKDGGNFKAQIASIDSNGDIIGWTDTDEVDVNGNIDTTTQEGSFDITIPNEDLISVLGEDTSVPADNVNDSLGNITHIEIGTYSIGREMSTAKEILDSTKVGGYMGVSQVNIDTANDNTPDFMAGGIQSNPNVIPLVSDDATASVSYDYTMDVYAKGSNNWYKELYGVEINGITYELENDQFPIGSGLTYTKTKSSNDPLKSTGGKIEIDTSIFTDELTGMKLLCRPTNSQYTTYVSEYEDVNDSIDQLLQDTVDNIDSMTDEELLSYLDIDDIDEMTEDNEYYDDLYEDADDDSQTPKTPLTGSALTESLKALARAKALSEADFSELNAEQIESVLKQIKRLIAQASGTYAAEPTGGVNEYYLTEENKDYLASQIEQLKLYQRKLDALNESNDFSDAVNAIYNKAIDDGLNLPVSSPVTDEDMTIITKLTDEIEALESQYNTLTNYEKTIIDEETESEYKELLDAIEMSKDDILTNDEIFNTRVDTIDDMITGDSPYTIDDPDLALKRINQAYDMYDAMTKEEQAEVGVKKSLLDELKEKLEVYLNEQAADFAKSWLTTDYTGTVDTPGSTVYDNDVNRLDSDTEKDGYTHRVSLAKDKYDSLPTSVQAAVDKLFNTPTVPQLYTETFPDVSDLLDVDDETAADNFISTYLTINGSVITDATKDTYQKILDAEDAWDNLVVDVQTEVNRKLTEDYDGKTYPVLLKLAKTINDALTGADSIAQVFIDQYLRYNGSVITDATRYNKNTILDAKDAWDALDSGVQEAVDVLLTNTYKGLTYDELYDLAKQLNHKKSDSDTTDTSGTTDTSKTTDASPVVVDGVSYKIGTQETTNGVTTVTPDQEKLNDKLEKAKENGAVIIPIVRDDNANAGAAALNLKNIEDMAEKKITLSIQEKSVSYDLPTVDVNTEDILTELGATDSEKVTVEISITNSDEKTQGTVETDVKNAGANVVVSPMEFKVTASYGGKNLEVSRFSNYVSRTVEITEEQAKKITTAIVHEASGKIRHVPTFVYQKDGSWYAEINSCTNSVYTLIYNEVAFPDAEGKWYEKVVNEMGSRMIIFGRENGDFEGSANITRAEFAAILIRALGLPADGNVSVFTDVQKDQWFYGAVGTAYEYGLISGKTNNTFDPKANITREEAMLMIARAAKNVNFTGSYGELTAFTDAKNVSTWALDGVKFNVGSGIIVGSNGKLCPKDNISRAESAAVILRLLQKAEMVDIRSNT